MCELSGQGGGIVSGWWDEVGWGVLRGVADPGLQGAVIFLF